MDVTQLADQLRPLLTPSVIWVAAIWLAISVGVQISVCYGVSRIVAHENSSWANAARYTFLGLLMGVVATGVVLWVATHSSGAAWALPALLALTVSVLMGGFILPMYVYEIDLPHALYFLLFAFVGNLVVNAGLGFVARKLTPQSATQQMDQAALAAASSVSEGLTSHPTARGAGGHSGKNGKKVTFSPLAAASDPTHQLGAEASHDPLAGKQVRLTSKVTLDLSFQGGGGDVELDRGTELTVVDGNPDQLQVIYLDNRVWIPRNKAAPIK